MAELQVSVEIIDAYILPIPTKAANAVLKATDSIVQHRPAALLQHLRRLVKPEHLPSSFRPISVSSDPELGGPWDGLRTETSLETPLRHHMQGVLYFLICTTSSILDEDIPRLLRSIRSCFPNSPQFQLQTIQVPIHPPTSGEQAKAWSQRYWPTIFKNNNPFGPHASIIMRAEFEMRGDAPHWMDLARQAGQDMLEGLRGEPIGVAVVNRHGEQGPSAVVVAGDARWNEFEEAARSGSGNVMAHGVMRAISLVARKRRALVGDNEASENDTLSSRFFADGPLTRLESEMLARPSIARGGYLCLGLEIYTTHEPCVMCSMAILHSRFGRIVFGQHLPRTGGLAAELLPPFTAPSGNDDDYNDEHRSAPSQYYGLFWRPELNWKLPAWQWIDDPCPWPTLSSVDAHA